MTSTNGSNLRQRGHGEIWGDRAHAHQARGVRFGVYDAVDMEIEPHVHEDRHLIFVLKGNYITSAANAPPVTAAPILVDNPVGTAHRDRFLHSHGRFLAINIAPAQSHEGKAYASSNLADIARMVEVIEELRFESPTVVVEEVAAALVDRTAAPAPSGRPQWIDRAYDMIMEESAPDITLDRLANEAGVHPVHIARTFRRLCGRTAGQLIRDRQFERACALLSNRDRPAADIALQLGFCDQAHFSHFFRQRAGITPGQYRLIQAQV